MDYLLFTSSIFYLLASCIAGIRLVSPNHYLNRYFITVITIALTGHAYWLYQNIVMLHGQNLPILNVLALVAFIISLLSTFAGKRFNTGVLQPIVYSCTVINLIAISYLPSQFITHIEAHPLLALHILLALLAYSILSIASLFALQLAYLDYRLKHRKLPLTKITMPPMMSLEKSLFQIIALGFILLSCTLLTGFVFIDNMFTQGKAHQVIFSMIAWVIYALLLWGHFTRGWRGRFTIYITIAGSSLLTLAYFGSRFVQEIILN